MQAKLSKSLDALLARVLRRVTQDGIHTQFTDHLALEILSEEGSLAQQVLLNRIKDFELELLTTRLRDELYKTGSGTVHGAAAAQAEPGPEARPSSEDAPASTDGTSELVAAATPKGAKAFFDALRQELLTTFAASRSISTAHVLLHIVSDPTILTSQILDSYGVGKRELAVELQKFTTPHMQRAEVRFIDPSGREHNFMPDSEPEDEGLMLDKFATDLTRQAHDGELDPVIGRDEEIGRMIRILSRRKKNNPILIGEAGVGKTAIAEGLAIKIAAGDVPSNLKNKRIWSLDVASLVAGTKFRGEFEERMHKFIELLSKNRDTILFIDEIHTITGAGSSQGSLDTANILKPALARGEMQVIGATTLNEFRENIEKDAALERRFQKIIVEPATADATLEILRKIVSRYEKHHGVTYSEEALRECVELTGRYISDRYFPDKAIDVLDEAGVVASGEVMPEHVRTIVTSMTGIPVDRLSKSEYERLQGLQSHLDGRVIGQREAVEKVSRSIRRSRAGFKDEKRPIGVFMFVGPTGVGKTLLAKEVSKWLFDEKKGLVRIDMSEYNEKHNVARLIGSPPGYVGYGEGGQLTEAVRRHPYAVVLFDEIEKAHPEVFNALLQIFDEGFLTDGQGRKVDFRNTVIVMTSNVGSHAIRRTAMGFDTPSKTDAADNTSSYRKALEGHFAPEFLNRVDDVVVFRTLTLEDVERIVDLELRELFDRVERMGYSVEITDQARRLLATLGYEQQYGVRALRRTLTERVEDPLTTLVIDEKLKRGDKVIVENHHDDQVLLRVA